MKSTVNRIFRTLAGVLAIGVVGLGVRAGAQSSFEPGQAIEYKVGFAVPETWERGVIIRALDGGKQYLIHEKPSEFFPKGSERAYAPENLRTPRGAQAQPADPGQTKPAQPGPTQQPGPGAKPAPGPAPATPAPAAGVPLPDRVAGAKGLLSEEDVLAYARTVFGGANQEVNQAKPGRDVLTERIRDYIKEHGTNFQAPAAGAFDNRINEQGTRSAHIIQAINDNFGAPPRLEDYFGTFLLRTANRGSSSVGSDATGKKWLRVTDEQHESGRLTLRPDGTYEWELLRGDPPAKWIRGRWREAKPGEMLPTEGGPALWLDHTNGGEAYMVRMDREPGYAGWINVGVGPGRRPVQYGRPSGAK